MERRWSEIENFDPRPVVRAAETPLSIGEFLDFKGLMHSTYTTLMGGQLHNAERSEALADGCATCHRGESTTQPESVRLLGHSLQVPILTGIGTRTRFMHDGRSDTLHHAVVDMLEQTRPGAALPSHKWDHPNRRVSRNALKSPVRVRTAPNKPCAFAL